MAIQINLNDKRLLAEKAEGKAVLKDSNEMYDDMVEDTGSYYNAQVKAVNDYEKTQKKQQQAATDFAISEIKQQKKETEQDYTKEQAGAWSDYQKQVDPYGAQAEQVAAQGLDNSGYADSLQTKAFVAYQNRVATARESFQRAVVDYDNAITEARLQNNSALAEIAYRALQQRLEYSLAGFQYKNTLIIDKANQGLTIRKMYKDSYQDVLNQINTENAFAEQQRQYNATLAENKRQFDAQMSLEQSKFNWQKAQAAAKSSGSGGSGGSKKSSKKVSSNDKKYAEHISNEKKNTNKNGVKAVNKNDELTVDMKSVLNLGYGPISASQLNKLVSQGTVQEYKEDGKLKYRKVFKR